MSFQEVFRLLLKRFLMFFEGFVLAEFGFAVNLAKQSLVHIDSLIFHFSFLFKGLGMQVIEFITNDLFIGKQLLFDDIPQILILLVLTFLQYSTLYFLTQHLTTYFALFSLCLLPIRSLGWLDPVLLSLALHTIQILVYLLRPLLLCLLLWAIVEEGPCLERQVTVFLFVIIPHALINNNNSKVLEHLASFDPVVL